MMKVQRSWAWLFVLCACDDGSTSGSRPPSGQDEAPAGPSGPASGPNESLGGQTGEGGGQSTSCSAAIWPGPESQRKLAYCSTGDGGSRDMVRCTCDLKACGSDDNGNLPTNCSKEVSIAGTTCDDVLFQTCKTRPDMTGFCEREALTPGRSVVCWTQSDGTHRCRCPENEAQVVASSEKTCDTALRVACASECGNSDGECKRTGDGYRCSCTAGISGTAPDYLCEDALRRWCAPACESAKGKCWVRPDGTDGADCRCAGSSTLTHVARADVSADSDACRGPLVKACGQ